MNRRKFIKIGMAGAAGTAAGAIVLSTCFKPPLNLKKKSIQLLSENDRKSALSWRYTNLDPDITAEKAYQNYSIGGCMYGVFKGIVFQVEEQNGEPHETFPYHMMTYGAGGIGDYGSVCGALNGAAAVIGLFVRNKKNRNYLLTDLFSWYEKTNLPKYIPHNPKLNLKITPSISDSVLCHVSATNWGKVSGYRMNGKEQIERCRRLTADVVRKAVIILNDFFDDRYITSNIVNEAVSSCNNCHNKGSKLHNTIGQMNCTPCHSTSLGHRIFADIHYKLLKKPSD